MTFPAELQLPRWSSTHAHISPHTHAHTPERTPTHTHAGRNPKQLHRYVSGRVKITFALLRPSLHTRANTVFIDRQTHTLNYISSGRLGFN